jgi:bacterial/archaeal transporter family-2 protein
MTSGRGATVIATAAAVVMGMLIAGQSRINGELGLELGDGFVAALISFGVGLVLLTIGMLAARSGRAGLGRVAGALRERRIPWWYVAGGTAGGFLVLCQGLVAATLGVALFTVATVCGQTVSAMIIDRRGLGTLPATPFTVPRVAGALLALVAVGIAVGSRVTGSAPLWMLILPVLAGVGIGWQQAVNGQVRRVAGSALTSTFINFVVGTAVLVVAALVHVGVAGPPKPLPASWWLYLGGAVGVVFIAGAAIIVHITGVLLMGLATIAGQLIASVLLDVLVPAPGHEVVATTLVGTALTLVAVGVTAIPVRRRAAT